MFGENVRPDIQGTRDLIFEYVKAHPGTHLRRIGRELGLGNGDLQYNLYILEKQGKVSATKRGLYKFVFPSGIFGEKETAILSALSTESQREILIHLMKNPALSQSQIAHLVGLTPATISWHMKRLVDLGLVERVKNGKQVNYLVLGDKEEIEKFVRNYHAGFWERLSSKLTDIVLELSANDLSRRKE
ncbi:MAG: winged helix-turn-helix transcriptional regulator [Nitrososphaerota archaeon]|nr:winged helix-turn-helix transcriptional regulator [Nitrososphaerota archaeon]MDG6922827.1 winged helix-turn-helix transcriptional regulator [Nitrososphaerota archaeon]